MARSPPKAHWAEAIDHIWSDPEAEAYLLWPSDQPLPEKGPLQQLLARTQQILSAALRADSIQHQAAAEALKSKAVVLLTRLLHMLQQQSQQQQFTAPLSKDPFQSVWFCIVGTLTAVLTAIKPKVSDNIRSFTAAAAALELYKPQHSQDMASCTKQLEEYPGRLAIPLKGGPYIMHLLSPLQIGSTGCLICSLAMFVLLQCAAPAVQNTPASNSLPLSLHFSPCSSLSLYKSPDAGNHSRSMAGCLVAKHLALFCLCPSVRYSQPSDTVQFMKTHTVWICNNIFPPLVLAGWIESAPAVLRWSLEHQPPGFLQTIAIPLVDLLSHYLALSQQFLAVPSTSLRPIHLPGILAVMEEYHFFLSSPAAQTVPSSVIEKTAMSVTKCQAAAVSCACAGAVNKDADVGYQQLLRSRLVVEAAVLKVAGWCQHKQQGRRNPQQQQANKPSGKSSKSSRGNSGRQDSSSSAGRSSNSGGRAAAAAAGSEASSSSSTSRRGGPAAVPGSYAQLEVPPDHDLVAESLRSKALLCYSTMARTIAGSFRNVKGAGGLMAFARDALFVLQVALDAAALEFSSSSSSSNTSSSSISSSSSPSTITSASVCGTVSTAKLLLEALALAGADVAEGMDTDKGMEAVYPILSFLHVSLHLLPRTELKAFISERGSLLLQVLSLVLDMIQPHQPLLQQPTGASWSQLLQRVIRLITNFAWNKRGKAITLGEVDMLDQQLYPAINMYLPGLLMLHCYICARSTMTGVHLRK